MHVATVAIGYVCITLLQIPQDYTQISYVHMHLNNEIFVVHSTPKISYFCPFWYIVELATVSVDKQWTQSVVPLWTKTQNMEFHKVKLT